MSTRAGTEAGVICGEALARAGVPHGFSERAGGVSRGVFSSLNFGNPMDLSGDARDPVSHIEENFRRVLVAIGAPGREVVQVYQVHGAACRVFREGGPSRDLRPEGARDFRADALVTDDPSRVVAVRVADCAPVLIASSDGRVVAAVHAGWRGVIAGVVKAAAEAMRGLGGPAALAAVGPCISRDAFEVGPEVLAEFVRVFGDTAPITERPDGKGLVDLRECLRRQLVEAGVASPDALPGCTFGEPERFFSHRREKGLTGRMVGLIGPRA
ncbi:MAG: laccase domain-containing protein [Phycisphaerales bacterium]|nr:laccase domain-containing protein [Phycisphaerales bacterium]